jgi:hypothetical protein
LLFKCNLYRYVTARVTLPPTGLNGAALLEMVHADGTPVGIPASVLVMATDAALAATMNTALAYSSAAPAAAAAGGATAGTAAGATRPSNTALYALGAAIAGARAPVDIVDAATRSGASSGGAPASLLSPARQSGGGGDASRRGEDAADRNRATGARPHRGKEGGTDDECSCALQTH